jgi:hypothetical protein
MSTDPFGFEVPEGYTGDIGNPLEGEGVRLPFAAPYVWWVNGKDGYKNERSPRFFGGWAMKAEDMALAIDENRGINPNGWNSFDMTSDDGNEYVAYLNRKIFVAVLGTRFRWLADVNKGQYQVLVYLGFDQDKKIIPFTPAVLTAKGTAGMFLRTAINDFSTKTSTLRRKLANNLPVSAFYACLGTFGEVPVIKSVGTEKKKNVTPVSLWMPANLDEGFLRAMFVGSEIAGVTAGLKKEAADWLAAWKQPAQQAQPQQQAQRQSYADDMPEFSPPPPDDDMPF